jgi:hypothetical protein
VKGWVMDWLQAELGKVKGQQLVQSLPLHHSPRLRLQVDGQSRMLKQQQ